MRVATNPTRRGRNRRPLSRERARRGIAGRSSVSEPLLAHRWEFDGTNSITWSTGQDIGSIPTGEGRTWDFVWRPNNRSFRSEPAAGSTAGTLLGLCNSSQVGAQIDVGQETGVCRLVVSSGATTFVGRFAIPGAGDNRVTLTALNNGGNSFTFRVYVNSRLVLNNTTVYTGGLVSGETNTTLGARLPGSEVMGVGAVSRARYYTTGLSGADVTTVFANGRPQDSAGPTPASDIWFGSGTGDTTTSWVDQSGNARNATPSGSAPSKPWDPARRRGLVLTKSGTSTTGYTNFGTATASAGTNGVRITTSAIDPRACVYYTLHPLCALNWRMRVVIQVDTANVQVIGLGRVPIRSGAGAVVAYCNLNSKVASISAGEFDANFDPDGEVVRSPTNASVPQSGGGTSLPDTGSAGGNQYEGIIEVAGNHVTALWRNLTNDQPPLRLWCDLNHELVNSTRLTTPSPGYPAVFSLLNTSTVEIISLEYWENTVENPEWLVLGESLINVDQDNWVDGWTMKLNTMRESNPTLANQWIEPYGGPGARIQDITTTDTATNGVRDIGANRAAIQLWVNSAGASGAAAAQTELEALQSRMFGWSSPPSEAMHLASLPLTAGAVTAEAWKTNQAAVAALDARASFEDEGWAENGDPPGTNNQLAANMDDPVHPTVAGQLAYATSWSNAGVFN